MVKCFRTVTGDEVLAEIVSEDAVSITIKNPIAMVMTPARELAGIPWLPLATPQNFTLSKAHLTIIYTPNDDVIANYRQQTGGIITAPAGALNQLEARRRNDDIMLPREF
jgi:hypothetical protein